MRGFLLGLSVSLAFIVGVLSARFLIPEAKAKPNREVITEPELEMPIAKWEYTCYRAKLNLNLLEVANKAGELGWEMIVTDGQGEHLPVWCFKRRRQR